jgi:hypothetical protein
VSGHAIEEGPYRYYLRRAWGADLDRLAWIMLNPSTADATTDDPTIRRCIRFTQREGYAGMIVVNLFALRATNPAGLHDHQDPVGPRNRRIVDGALHRADAAVAAWGATVDRHPAAGPERDYALAVAARHHRIVYDLGTTKAGHPRHPLYVAADTPLHAT